MNQTHESTRASPAALPKHRGLYYGGAWHPAHGGYSDTFNPATGANLGPVAQADVTDVEAAVRSAQEAFSSWSETKPRARGLLLRKVADTIRANAEELGFLDAINCGNPITAMIKDVHDGAE